MEHNRPWDRRPTEQDIQSLMDMPALIDNTWSWPRSRSSRICHPALEIALKYPNTLVRWTHAAYLPEGNALGVEVLTLRTDNPTLGLPAIHATVLLINPRDGRLLAIGGREPSPPFERPPSRG